jgi:hypothetical protein
MYFVLRVFDCVKNSEQNKIVICILVVTAYKIHTNTLAG